MGRPILTPGYHRLETARLEKELSDATDELDWTSASKRGLEPPHSTPPATPPSPSSPVLELFLDPSTPAGQRTILRGLIASLTPLAQAYILQLPSPVLQRATKFEEHVHDGILSIKIYRRADMIGICHTRLGEGYEEGEAARLTTMSVEVEWVDSSERLTARGEALGQEQRWNGERFEDSYARRSPSPPSEPVTPSSAVLQPHTLSLPISPPPPRHLSPSPTPSSAPPSTTRRWATPPVLGAPPVRSSHRGLGEGWAAAAREVDAAEERELARMQLAREEEGDARP